MRIFLLLFSVFLLPNAAQASEFEPFVLGVLFPLETPDILVGSLMLGLMTRAYHDMWHVGWLSAVWVLLTVLGLTYGMLLTPYSEVAWRQLITMWTPISFMTSAAVLGMALVTLVRMPPRLRWPGLGLCGTYVFGLGFIHSFHTRHVQDAEVLLLYSGGYLFAVVHLALAGGFIMGWVVQTMRMWLLSVLGVAAVGVACFFLYAQREAYVQYLRFLFKDPLLFS